MIKKELFRDQIRELLYKSLTNGEILLGQKLSLAEYGRKLQISVTPIRESFTQLEQEGILEAVPNVGFCVKNISVDEAREIYELIGVLEEFAIMKSSYTPEKIGRLRNLANKVEAAKKNDQRLRADNLFHEELIGPGYNHLITTILKGLKTKVLLYELQYMNNKMLNYSSSIDHKEIIDLLEDNEIKKAARLNKEHWMKSYQFIVKNNEKK